MFRGTTEEHAATAKILLRELRQANKRHRRNLAKGDCKASIKSLVEVSGYSNAYGMERVWLDRAGVKKFPSQKGQKKADRSFLKRVFKVCKV